MRPRDQPREHGCSCCTRRRKSGYAAPRLSCCASCPPGAGDLEPGNPHARVPCRPRTGHWRLAGLAAHLAGVCTPRPGTTLYEQVELVDSETRQRLASLPFVEVETSGAEVTIRLPYPAIINGNRLDAFWRVAGDTLRRSAPWRQLRRSANLTLHLNDGDQTFTDVAAQAVVDDEQARLSLGFRPATAGTAPAEAAELTIACRRRGATPASVYKFTTGAAGLPCSLLVSFWPDIDRVGRSGAFAGSVSAHEQAGRWRAELKGRLSGIDLGLLLADFPHKFTGMAEAQLDLVPHRRRARGRGRGAVDRRARVCQPFAHRGRAGQPALASHARSHRWPRRSPIRPHGDCLRRRRRGLTMRGATERPGAIIVDPQERVLMHQAARQVPVVSLVRTLVPQSAVQVPATRETAGLVTWLPVPSIAARAGDEEPTLKARLLPIPIRK